jgi:uncharacterized membrane protein
MIPEWFRLIGVVIILAGLAMRMRTTVVVLAAALATGVAAGIAPLNLLSTLGKAFVDNRLMTLFLITLPAIGLSERFGLREQSAKWIHGIRAATPGRLAIAYQCFRVLHGIMGIRLSGHAVFVRPLVYPMAIGTVSQKQADKDAETIKAATAASENYGNFYGQNLSPVQAGVLLVYSTLTNLGCSVSLWGIVWNAIPIMLLSLLAGAVQFLWYDRHWFAKRKADG